MKIFSIIAKVVLSLLLISPILGALGIFPPPTPDLYNTPQAFSFIQSLYDGGYIVYLIAIVFALAIFFLWTKREALAALLILPVAINIIGFHAFLDGGLFTAGALMADVLFLLTLYFLYQNCARYRSLFERI